MTDKKDIIRLQDLAKKVAEIVAGDINKERLRKYKAINSLSIEPPPILFVPPPMDEAINDLYDLPNNCKISDPFLAKYESQLLQTILREKVIGDDLPTLGIIYSGFEHAISEWMDDISYHHFKNLKDNKSDHSVKTFFDPCIKELDDIEKLKYPVFLYDKQKTKENYERLKEIFEDILPVIMGSPFNGSKGWGESLIDEFVTMRGLEQFYYDLVDNPEWVHKVMRILTDGKRQIMQYLLDENILCLNNTGTRISSCSPGFTDELPAKNFDPDQIRKSDLWGFAQAQELSEVSPEMVEEFVVPYQAELVNGFGLVCYGCCEPMEYKIDVAERHFKNLRMISINPFTNHEIAAPKCKGKYVYSWKPSSAHMAFFDEEKNKQYLRDNLRIIKDCSTTITLEDTYEYGNDVGRFKRWVELAREVIHEIYG